MAELPSFTHRYTALESVTVAAEFASALAAECERRGYRRVLVVGSASLLKNQELRERLRQALGTRLAAVTTCVGAHTPRPAVLEVTNLARAVAADVLVALGGGSVIDACKAAQLALDQAVMTESDLLRFARRADGSEGPEAGKIDHPVKDYPLRIIAIPTTLSGAEFSDNAGVLDPELKAKEGYRAPGLCPQAILYDPELGRYAPDWLWLSTAIRALDHAVEGLLSQDCNAFLEGQFLQALRLFAESLPEVVADPDNLAARSRNQQAVWLACAGLGTVAHGASHGIGYVLGSLCGVPHGYTSCVMLPAVLAWNNASSDPRDASIAAALGNPDATASAAVKGLVRSLGLPDSLSAVGVAENQLAEIAERAAQHPVVRRNSRPVETADQVTEILALARDSDPDNITDRIGEESQP